MNSNQFLAHSQSVSIPCVQLILSLLDTLPNGGKTITASTFGALSSRIDGNYTLHQTLIMHAIQVRIFYILMQISFIDSVT